MLDLLKVLIERIFSWPVASLIIALVFQKQIVQVIARVESLALKTGDNSATLNLRAEEAQKAPKNDNQGIVPNLAAGEDATAPIPEEIEARRRSILGFGIGIPAVEAQAAAVRMEMEAYRFPPNTPETTEVLIRHLAAAQVYAKAEMIYRLIFGSQLKALLYLNVHGPAPEARLRQFYETARKDAVAFYKDYPFEQWLKFLLDQRLIAIEEGRYCIVQNGRDFLAWIMTTGLSMEKYG